MIEVPHIAFGSITGRVKTVGNILVLYDLVDDAPITCLEAGNEQEMAGRLVTVHGEVTRDPKTGRALSVHHITHIECHEEPEPGAWRQARGALPPLPDGETPEGVVRKIRDE